MQTIMKLVPYEEFGCLRLQSFGSNNNLYEESFSQDHFIAERILGKDCSAVNFIRYWKRPDELALIGISPERSESIGWASNIAPSILSAIGLRLEAGLSLEETASRFGTPPHWQSKDGLHVIFLTGGNSPYEVHCDYNPADNAKLNRVMVHRLDIEEPHEKDRGKPICVGKPISAT